MYYQITLRIVQCIYYIRQYKDDQTLNYRETCYKIVFELN